VNARRNDVTQNPLEAPGSDHRSGEALARPIGRVVRFLVAPALAIMNGMNYVLKFLLVSLPTITWVRSAGSIVTFGNALRDATTRTSSSVNQSRVFRK
jgi:hypothetical protein